MKQDTVNFNIKSIKEWKVVPLLLISLLNSLAAIYSTAFSLSLKSFTSFLISHSTVATLSSKHFFVLPLSLVCQCASTSCQNPRVLSVLLWSRLPSLSLFDNKRELMPRVIKAVCSSKNSISLFHISRISWYQPTTFFNSLFINNWAWCWFKMPTTRQKRKPGDVLLSGLPEEKRPRSEKSADSTSSRKPAAKKGKKVLYPHVPCIMEITYKWLLEKNRDPNLPYVKLANDLLRRGDELLLSGPSATLGQITEPPRVWGPRDEPINDPTQLPKGWTASETDLAHE